MAASLARPMRRLVVPGFTSSSIPSYMRKTGVVAPATAALRIADFHTTSPRAIVPPPRQVMQGTVNDPAPIPPASPSHGSYHWTFERTLAAALIPISIAPFASGSLNPTMDALLCSMLLIHSHMGFQNIITDYVPGRRFPKSRKAFNWSLNLATVLVAVGLYEFETNDVGVTEAVSRLWKA